MLREIVGKFKKEPEPMPPFVLRRYYNRGGRDRGWENVYYFDYVLESEVLKAKGILEEGAIYLFAEHERGKIVKVLWQWPREKWLERRAKRIRKKPVAINIGGITAYVLESPSQEKA